MKINLVSAILRGDEFFTPNIVSPSAVTVYYKIVVLLNRQGWHTITLKTSLKALGDATHLQPYRVKNALKELSDLQLICTQSSLDSLSTCNQLAISLSREAYPDAVSKTDKIHARKHGSQAGKHTHNADSLPDTTDTQKISETAKKVLHKLKGFHFFDDDITYAQSPLPFKQQILINCIAGDIKNMAKGEISSLSFTSERLLREHFTNTREFIETYM